MPAPLQILIVEDSPADAALMLAELRRAGFNPNWKRVETEPDFLSELDKKPDLILSDYSMPQFSGLRAAELVKASGLNIPFILISGTVGEDVAVAAMKHGATDYLLKDRIARLGKAVERALAEKQIRDERQRAEQALATLHRRYELILNSMAEGIHGIDCQGNITFENVAAARMFGQEINDLVGQPAHALIHHSHADGSAYPVEQCPIYATLRDGLSRRVDTEVFWRKDGTSFPVAYETAPNRDEQGAIVGTVVVFRDITEHRKLEAQFRQAQKMEAIGQLAGGVAHDINNILTSILLQVTLGTMADTSPSEIQEGFQQIRCDAERAATLVRQLLLFSRRQVMQPRNLDLNEVVTNLAKLLQRIIGEDVRLQLNLHPTPLWTHADAGMLEQVLMNLAVNARDAMPEGGRLKLETLEHDVVAAPPGENPDAAPGRYVCLSVADNGCGIPAGVLPRIFEPFFTTKEPGKGTGLGLATVFGIVKQHHGWIRVDSRPGDGTTFQVFLPASVVAAAPVATPARPKPRGGTETILLAEDDAAVRKTTQMLLTRSGYTVLEAATGAEAIKVWEENRASVSLLLTDLVMPAGVSGQELARRLQADQPQLKVVYISGYSAEIAGREIQLQEGENFLQKPFRSEDFLQTIRTCLDG